jgi:hypothetical protein
MRNKIYIAFLSLIGPLACCGVYDDGILVWPTTEVNQTVTFLCPVQEEHGMIKLL